ncbi:hypothetical protein PDJAM_G00147140 [Pangasius djambal]|uniref:Uncharacterized protein n=1 Tax=Pangasius djambal TaxID=1691987 RepID=A0ACC5ZGU9_9TELE|nr:hypothetical protein [Pangasius djambal]
MGNFSTPPLCLPPSRAGSQSLTHSRAVSSARGLPEQGSTRNELSISGNFEPHAHRVDSLVRRRFAHRERILHVRKDAWTERAGKYDHNCPLEESEVKWSCLVYPAIKSSIR